MAQIVKLRRSSVSGQKPVNSNLQLGEIALNTVDGKAFMSVSGSNGPTIEEFIITNTVNTGSIYLTGNVTASNFTGSFIGDGSRIYNIPLSGFTGLQLDRITSGSSEAIISPNGLKINTDTTITGSLRATSITGSIDWVNIINEPALVSGSSQITYSGITGLPNILLSSQTSSMTVLSASFATTAAFALNVIGGGTNEVSIGAYRSLNQTTPQVTWSFQHNIGQRYPIFQVFNNDGDVVIPTQIKTIDEDYSEILFSTPQTGIVIASLGGGNGRVEQFTSSSLWIVNHNLGTEYPNVTVWDSDKRVITPNTIESITNNQIEISFSGLTSGYVSVTRGGHILTGSMQWQYISDKPVGIVSGSSQLTGSYDSRYVLSGSITQTTWDNIENKPVGIVSGSIQVDITGTTGYSTFSSSIATTDLTQNNRLGSLETESGSIRNNFNSFTSSYTTVSSSLDNRLDILETYSGSQLVPSASMSFRTLQTDVYCKNITGTQINKGTVVRIVGSVGDNALIGVANPSTELTSANVLGIATQNIPNDSFGLVITEGVLTGVNTDGMTAGALLYLGTGGIFTITPPTAPNHGVRLGEVLRVHQNQGSIYVRVDNGIELNEAHDVIYTGITHGDLLIRSGSVWKNSKSLNGNYVITGSLSITQNLTVFGSSSLVYVTSSQLAVSASTISVNIFEPAERFGGLKVYDSGSSNATASLLWDSLNNHWIYENVSGSNYSGGMLLSGPRNSGSLGDEIGLINGIIPKSVGGDHLDNSIISESGNTITISGNLVVNSLTGAVDFNSLINRPTLVSGSSQILNGTGIVSSSNQLTGSYDSRYVLSGSITQTTWDNIANKPVGIVSGSGQLIGIFATTGSNNFIGTEQITGSLIVSGSVIISGSLDLSNANIDSSRYLHTQTNSSLTWSVTHNLNYDYPNVTIYDGSTNKIMLPNDIVSIDENSTEITFASPEYGYALISVGGITTATADRYLHTVSSPTGSWIIDHNFNYKYININVYDNNDEQLIPQKITAVSVNRTQIDFAIPTSGNAIITTGGPKSTALFNQNGSYYNTNYNIGITGSLVVTGDVDASNFNTTSDKKIKTNLEKVENALEKIDKINGYTFNWLESYNENKTRQIGMLANEVHDVQPELTTERNVLINGNEETILLLDYSKVTTLLIEAVKELNKKVKKLENKKNNK
jgi:hypothetical protein